MILAIALFCLLLGATARADPVTVGSWIATRTPDLEIDKSEDCSTCAAVWYLPVGTEWLQGGFGYDNWPGSDLVLSLTEYRDALRLSYDGHSFAYDNGHGFSSSSWGGSHQRLYRQTLAHQFRYWLAIEDLPNPFYFDRNDAMYTWTENLTTPVSPPLPAPPPPLPPAPTPAPIPEPGTLLLLATGIGLLVRRALTDTR